MLRIEKTNIYLVHQIIAKKKTMSKGNYFYILNKLCPKVLEYCTLLNGFCH